MDSSRLSRRDFLAPQASALFAGAFAMALGGLFAAPAEAAPKVILISLDGATPRLVDQYAASGALPAGVGLRLLEEKGVKAAQNLTINPSLTAAAHIAIATGSNAAANDIPGNAFRLHATPSTSTFTTSGFGAPIGGYHLDPVGISPFVTAVPMWSPLRAAGKKVVTATWPGGDGVNVTVPGGDGTIVQPASERTVDYTVPFGATTSPFQRGFTLTGANFADAPAPIVTDLAAAGRPTFSQAKQADLESFTTMGVTFTIKAVALDSTDDGVINYDTIAIYNTTQGINGPFTPSPLGTGPAYLKPGTNLSALFFLEGNTLISGASVKGGVRYFASFLAPDLSTVRLARTSVAYIARQNVAATAATVLANISDIEGHVGFWQPQPDFRIVEKLDATPSTFASFPDIELESIYMELVDTWTTYQKNIVLHALSQLPDADLAMFYFEQPDGSGHQFFLTDPRQPTDFTNANSIGAGQDPVKKARYAAYLENAYVQANGAVQAVIDAVGVNGSGVPNSNIIVTSDHGFETFHTAVQMSNLLSTSGIDLNKIRVVTSGPAANIYIRLSGRNPGETVTRTEYLALQQHIANVLKNYQDTNNTYTLGQPPVQVFDQVISRPLPAEINDATFGLRTSEFIGQDSGDVFATLVPGYNFDGAQNPLVTRLGDFANNVFSVPNFYGAHGYDPTLPNMSAIFYAAGPDIVHNPTPIPIMANMDIAPTIMRILGVAPVATVQGRALRLGPAPLTLQKAVSRKAHGAAGNQDVTLPLPGGGVEGRNAGAGNSHSIVFTFSNDISTASAAVTSGTGTVSGSPVIQGSTVTVNLTGVPDQQSLTVTLTGVTDTTAGSLASTALAFKVLRGDVNGDAKVDAADVSEVKAMALTGGPITVSTVRGDVLPNGTVNASDAAFVNVNLGHQVP